MPTTDIRTKYRKTRAFHIQPARRVINWCGQNGYPTPASRKLDRRVLQLALDGEIGLDVFAYYVYVSVRANHLRKWAKAEANELGVSVRVIERFRRELRKHRLMTTLSLGTQTYTIHPMSQLSESTQRKLQTLAVEVLKKNWQMEVDLSIPDTSQPIITCFQRYWEDPAYDHFWIFCFASDGIDQKGVESY